MEVNLSSVAAFWKFLPRDRGSNHPDPDLLLAQEGPRKVDRQARFAAGARPTSPEFVAGAELESPGGTEQSHPRRDTTPVAMPAMDLDIRQYVTRRAEDWRAPSASRWNGHFISSEQPDAPRVVSAGHYGEPPLPNSQRIIFPRHQPNPAAVQRLAAPLQLCCNAAAAGHENSFHSRGGRMSPEVEAWQIDQFPVA